MLTKLVRRLLASAAAAMAMHPVSLAARRAEFVVMHGADIAAAEAEAKRLADFSNHGAGTISAETLAAYTGPKTVMSAELIALVRGSKRFRNNCVDAIGAKEELDKFIQERTR